LQRVGGSPNTTATSRAALTLSPKEDHVIRICTDGKLKFLHDDKVTAALFNDGDIKMTRATDVRFNNSEKTWEIFLPGTDTKVINVGFADRASALSAEKILLEKLL
jgi:hypothetical protein